MKFKMIALAAALAAAAPAFATIAPGSSGNGELFLAVYDNIAKVSYTKDLGITMSDFWVTGQTAGTNLSFAVNDTFFSAFLAEANTSNIKWAVMAFDSAGGTVIANPATRAGVNLFTTAAAGTPDALLGAGGGNNFTAGMGAAQSGNFFGAVNGTGTHAGNNVANNGASFNRATDASPYAYYGQNGGTGPTLNGTVQFSAGNEVGVAAEFFALGRSSQTNGLAALNYDAFDANGVRGEWLLSEGANGYSLAYAVPEPSTYALMLAGLAAVGFVARRRKSV